MDARVRQWLPVAEAVTRLLAPHAEVVLHCAETSRVLAIWNPLTGREPGDPSGLGELDRMTETSPGVYGPYSKLLPDGRRLSCVTAVLDDVLLCVNLDRAPLDQVVTMLSAFAAPITDQSPFEQDLTGRVAGTVGRFVRARGRQPSAFSREDRLDVLAELDRLGVFDVRHAVPVVARALAVSRSTVYSLRAEL